MPAQGKRTEIAYQRSGTVPIFAEALRSENGTVPFTPASAMPPNWGYLAYPLAQRGATSVITVVAQPWGTSQTNPIAPNGAALTAGPPHE